MDTVRMPRALLLAACVSLATLAATATSAAARSHGRRGPEIICVGHRGTLHLGYGTCRRNEKRLAVTRTRAHAAGGSATITTCVNKKGQLTLVSSSKKCKHGEKRLTWSVQGPRGETGATGATGSTGATGTPGKNGAVEVLGAENEEELELEPGSTGAREVPGMYITFPNSSVDYVVTASMNIDGYGEVHTEESAYVTCGLLGYGANGGFEILDEQEWEGVVGYESGRAPKDTATLIGIFVPEAGTGTNAVNVECYREGDNDENDYVWNAKMTAVSVNEFA